MSTDPVAVFLNAADAPIMVTGIVADTSNMTPSLRLFGSLLVVTVKNDKDGAAEGTIEGIMVGETDVVGILVGETDVEGILDGEDDGKLDEVGRIEDEGAGEGEPDNVGNVENEGAVEGAHPL
eukprot:scaffold32546_cov35-Cyclotella_meneghiniana.AAC.3